MSSRRTASSDKTQTQNLREEDKEYIICKPELATDFEVIAASSLNAQKEEWVTGFKLFTIITAVALVCLLMLLDTSIVSTVSQHRYAEVQLFANQEGQAIPRITSEFHSLADVGWYGSAYQLARCVLFSDCISSCVD